MAAAEAGVLYASDDDEGVNSFFVRALYDFSSEDASSLSFERGALIEVLTQLESGWWDGLLGNDAASSLTRPTRRKRSRTMRLPQMAPRREAARQSSRASTSGRITRACGS
jgi:son of sevenless-like protein